MGIECKPSDFLRSFLDYISTRDSENLHDTLYSMNFNREEYRDFIAIRYKVGPNKNQRRRFSCESCNVWIVVKTFDSVKCDKGIFWKLSDGLPRQSIEAIYEQYNPSQDKVLDYIDFKEPSDKMEETAFEHLKRYIDEHTFPTLQKLLRYVTGSTMILPGKKILTDTEVTNELEMRPKAQNCIKLLTIQKNSPFYAFQQCFQFYMEHGKLW